MTHYYFNVKQQQHEVAVDKHHTINTMFQLCISILAHGNYFRVYPILKPWNSGGGDLKENWWMDGGMMKHLMLQAAHHYVSYF